MASINWTNITNVERFLAVPNSYTNNWFWTAILFMLYIIILISLLYFGFDVALLGASFICLMIGIILVYMGLVSWTWVAMFAGVIVFTIIWIMYSKKAE